MVSRWNSSRIVAGIGGAVSLALMLYAGRRQPSLLLTLLFAGWVLLPFVAAAVLRSRATLAFTLASVAIYAAVAFGILHVKTGFTFLVVPFASLVVIGAARTRQNVAS